MSPHHHPLFSPPHHHRKTLPRAIRNLDHVLPEEE
jgi:hypothetical protein